MPRILRSGDFCVDYDDNDQMNKINNFVPLCMHIMWDA